jgi:hypothetical protein
MKASSEPTKLPNGGPGYVPSRVHVHSARAVILDKQGKPRPHAVYPCGVCRQPARVYDQGTYEFVQRDPEAALALKTFCDHKTRTFPLAVHFRCLTPEQRAERNIPPAPDNGESEYV